MGNMLCPPMRPGHGYYTEAHARHQQAGTSAAAEDDESKQPKLSSSEINHLPIEEYASPKEMMRWSVSKLMAELKRARRNSPADRSVLDGPMPLEVGLALARCYFAVKTPSR
jgi:hypothetical protein